MGFPSPPPRMVSGMFCYYLELTHKHSSADKLIATKILCAPYNSAPDD